MHDFQIILLVGQPTQTTPEELLSGFEQDGMISTLHCEDPQDAEYGLRFYIETFLPDLVCVFADQLEAEGTDVLELFDQLRDPSPQSRPVLIVQSDGPEEKRIQYLIQGADDILGSTLSTAEFRIRMLVHLRRSLDFGANEMTQLPGLQLATKVVQRRLNRQEPLALLTIELDQLDVYSEVYGELPTRQVLKTFAALLHRVILVPDLIGHSDENHFIIVTQPDRAEKIAAIICRQFESSAPNFYSEKDRKQGYMVSIIANNISRRVPLMSVSIGIATTQNQAGSSFLSLFNASQQMLTLARMRPDCSWQSDRLRLSGDLSIPQLREKPGILVLEPDAALAYLLKTTLSMEGYAVDVASNIADARTLLQEKAPTRQLHLLLLDALIHEETEGLQLASESHQLYPEMPIICISSLHDRQQVLQAGVNLYLPKPFELSQLFSWLRRLLPSEW